jgi:hypothetical protein
MTNLKEAKYSKRCENVMVWWEACRKWSRGEIVCIRKVK